MTTRFPETYQWPLVPVQATPQVAVTWEALRLSGTGLRSPFAPATSCAPTNCYLTGFAATRLRMELDRMPLWCGDHVP